MHHTGIQLGELQLYTDRITYICIEFISMCVDPREIKLSVSELMRLYNPFNVHLATFWKYYIIGCVPFALI